MRVILPLMNNKPTPPVPGPQPQSQPQVQPPQGPVRLASAFRKDDGQPRFTMTIPPEFLRDAGVGFMVNHEGKAGGYEYPTRRFLDEHMEPGDAFIDVGAHWGIFALQAATRHPGQIRVLAIEAHPLNAHHLSRIVIENGLIENIEVLSAAAGDKVTTAPLEFNSTMGHSLYGHGIPEGARAMGRISVPVFDLDFLIRDRDWLKNARRVFLKVDVEGFEPEVYDGMKNLLDSGKVAAFIWEQGLAFRQVDERRQRMEEMNSDLAKRGFKQFRFAHPEMGGPLIPYIPVPECCNVFALSPDLPRARIYPKPAGNYVQVSPACKPTDDPVSRAATTTSMIEHKTTDGGRWGALENLSGGAMARAEMAAKYVYGGERILDLGAGVMALPKVLPPGCDYQPHDLFQATAQTNVADLNQGQFPTGEYDIVVALEVFEFIHNLEAVLKLCANVTKRLILTYRVNVTDIPTRRSLGFVHDYDKPALTNLLKSAGWRVMEDLPGADTVLFDCERV